MWHWLAADWTAVRPNLEAGVIWALPGYALGIWHHRHVRRSLQALHSKVDAHQHPAGQQRG